MPVPQYLKLLLLSSNPQYCVGFDSKQHAPEPLPYHSTCIFISGRCQGRAYVKPGNVSSFPSTICAGSIQSDRRYAASSKATTKSFTLSSCTRSWRLMRETHTQSEVTMTCRSKLGWVAHAQLVYPEQCTVNQVV